VQNYAWSAMLWQLEHGKLAGYNTISIAHSVTF
jgi:hypothetical protein